jgi:hypothetical protein
MQKLLKNNGEFFQFLNIQHGVLVLYSFGMEREKNYFAPLIGKWHLFPEGIRVF